MARKGTSHEAADDKIAEQLERAAVLFAEMNGEGVDVGAPCGMYRYVFTLTRHEQTAYVAVIDPYEGLTISAVKTMDAQTAAALLIECASKYLVQGRAIGSREARERTRR